MFDVPEGKVALVVAVTVRVVANAPAVVKAPPSVTAVPLIFVQVIANAPLVVQSPLRSPVAIEVAPEKLAKLPVVGDPVVVTVPAPAGVAHTPSPRTKVDELAVPVASAAKSEKVAGVNAAVPLPLAMPVRVPTPMPPLPTGVRPVISVERLTAPKLGAPMPFPCSTVVVVPREPRLKGPLPVPPPSIS